MLRFSFKFSYRVSQNQSAGGFCSHCSVYWPISKIWGSFETFKVYVDFRQKHCPLFKKPNKLEP